MKAYIINLKKDKIKLAQAMSRLKNLSLDITRVEATYGKEVSSENIRRYSTERIYNQIFDPTVRYMNISAWGCSHSHARTCKLILDNSDNKAIIFEDDFYWLDSKKKVMSILDALSQIQMDLALLGYSPRGIFDKKAADESGECIKIDSKYRLIPFKFFAGGAGGAYSYIVSNSMARRMWSGSTVVDRDADGFMELYEKEPSDSKGMYILFPPIAHSSLEDSNIWDKPRSTKSVIKKNILKFIGRNRFLLRIFARFQQVRLEKKYISHTKTYKINY